MRERQDGGFVGKKDFLGSQEVPPLRPSKN
jgi:hypothetical protein